MSPHNATTPFYGRAALRRLRDQQARHTSEAASGHSLLADVPIDAEYGNPGEIMHAWDGQRWIPLDKWLASAPLAPQPEPNCTTVCSDRVTGDCGGTRVVLAQEGERCFIYVGALRPANRRKDFASPSLAHAIRTAEQWYGIPEAGWHAAAKPDGKQTPAADQSSEVLDFA